MTKVDMIIDLQFGSTGKGLFAGYYAKRYGHDLAITANMPNAGHTFVDKDGKKIVFKVLPAAAVSETVKTVLIGPGAVFDPERLMSEIKELQTNWRTVPFTVRIHPLATVLLPEHAVEERKCLNHISSTMQGSMEAVIAKMRRNTQSPVAKEVLKNIPFLRTKVASFAEWADRIDCADMIIAEGAQGYSLGIDTSFYPYTTSRNCTPEAFLTAMGVPLRYLYSIIGTCRTFPIRVGSTVGGFSGDAYPDQLELSWEDIGVEPEKTTVTGRVRRVFTFSEKQIKEAVWACHPDQIFLNFCNYGNANNLNSVINSIIKTGVPIGYTGWGPKESDIEVGRRH